MHIAYPLFVYSAFMLPVSCARRLSPLLPASEDFYFVTHCHHAFSLGLRASAAFVLLSAAYSTRDEGQQPSVPVATVIATATALPDSCLTRMSDRGLGEAEGVGSPPG